MGVIFDLFGDPVPENHGRRGRPQHIPTQENRRKVNMMLAWGWNNERIAATLRITPPSLRKHYFSELKYRDVARDRHDAKIGMMLLEQGEAGNVAATKAYLKLVERNDLMGYGQAAPPERKDKQAPLGKKEQAALAAQNPDLGTPLGELMARRQQQGRPN